MSKKINPNAILSSVIGGTISAVIIGGALMLGFGISENNISDTTQTRNQQTKNLDISKRNIANSHLQSHRVKQSRNLHRHNTSNKHRGMNQKILQKKNYKNPKMFKNNSATTEKMKSKIIPPKNTMNQKMENLLETGAITANEYNELNTIIDPQNREAFIALLHEYLEDNKSKTSQKDSLKENKQTTKKKLRNNNMRNHKLSPR